MIQINRSKLQRTATLTLSMLRLLASKAQELNIFFHPDSVMLVFIGKPSLSTKITVSICQGFSSHYLY